MSERCERIRLHGLVQGVGMRPAVWRLARRLGLRGAVWNDGEGVGIEVAGEPADVESFVDLLLREAPPLARIDAVRRERLEPPFDAAGFSILASRPPAGAAPAGVMPDVATCADCLSEIRDPAARRYRYPFTNCTACGPRLSIVQAIPYDRANTTMRAFELCARCRAEYEDPADRRFHAQPIACPACGPRVTLVQASGATLAWPDGARDPVDAAALLLGHGRIVAIQGLGGFQLACDARDADAVRRLRAGKRRGHKPFAVMVRDLAQARALALLGPDDEQLLAGPAAPILLVPRRAGHGLAEEVAPGVATLGLMLPNTPLHHLLMDALDGPIVLTSGNLSDEPQAIADEDARSRLGGVADAFLRHDRPIARRVDDSVVRRVAGAPRVLRRARGHAPAPLPLPPGLDVEAPVLALGGDLKNSFCLLRRGDALLAHHVGDLHDARTQADGRAAIDQYLDLFRCAPALAVVDRHPDYRSSALGRALAAERGWAVREVQHHHAHAASCLAENGWPVSAGPALAIVLDGLGLGDDGTLWGGEFLLADYRCARRMAAFTAVPLPGGEQAVRQPWRNTWAHLRAAPGWPAVLAEHGTLELVRFLQSQPLELLGRAVARGVNSPAASSCGRLFDAVAGACGVCRDTAHYEGQAAVELEALVDEATWRETDDAAGYPFALRGAEGLPRLDPMPLWRALLQDLEAAVPSRVVAARFHRGLAIALTRMVELLLAAGVPAAAPLVLSGGVFHNRLLLEDLLPRLARFGRPVLTHRAVPAGDGGLALGQAVIAAAQPAGVC